MDLCLLVAEPTDEERAAVDALLGTPRSAWEGGVRVVDIDDATISALTALYRERIPAGARVLDLMSSWVSHLPTDVAYAWVAGLGMNAEELAHNPRLDERVVHDLNA